MSCCYPIGQEGDRTRAEDMRQGQAKRKRRARGPYKDGFLLNLDNLGGGTNQLQTKTAKTREARLSARLHEDGQAPLATAGPYGKGEKLQGSLDFPNFPKSIKSLVGEKLELPLRELQKRDIEGLLLQWFSKFQIAFCQSHVVGSYQVSVLPDGRAPSKPRPSALVPAREGRYATEKQSDALVAEVPAKGLGGVADGRHFSNKLGRFIQFGLHARSKLDPL